MPVLTVWQQFWSRITIGGAIQCQTTFDCTAKCTSYKDGAHAGEKWYCFIGWGCVKGLLERCTNQQWFELGCEWALSTFCHKSLVERTPSLILFWGNSNPLLSQSQHNNEYAQNTLYVATIFFSHRKWRTDTTPKYANRSQMPNHDYRSLPANVTETVESGLCVLSRPRRVEASFARLVKERRIVIPIIWVIKFHVHHTTCWTMALSVLLLLCNNQQKNKLMAQPWLH